MASGVNSIPSIPFFKTGLERGRIHVQSGNSPGLPRRPLPGFTATQLRSSPGPLPAAQEHADFCLYASFHVMLRAT